VPAALPAQDEMAKFASNSNGRESVVITLTG